jgi:glycosyltransferase involved in cell wall biosynthesis
LNSILSVFFKHKQGGFNKRLYELYLGLAERGAQVHYVAVEQFPIQHDNVHAHLVRVPCSARENYIFWACFIMTAPFVLLYEAQKHKIDCFVVFEPFYGCLCLLAKLMIRKPLVTFIRSDVAREYEISKKPWLQRVFNRLIEIVGLKSSDKIIPNSNKLARTLKERNRLDRGLFSVIPNNIREDAAHPDAGEKRALRRQYGISEDEFVVATASAFNKTKNLSFLVKSFSQANLTNARLLIIGDAVGKDKDGRRTLEERVRFRGIQEKTIFTGWLNDPRKLLAASDLFVLPSREEGSPNALLEALGCGIPCLGSRIAEIEEVLDDDELVFSLDSENELAEKIKRAAMDSEYYTLLCKLSHHQREKFTFDWEDALFKEIATVKGAILQSKVTQVQ